MLSAAERCLYNDRSPNFHISLSFCHLRTIKYFSLCTKHRGLWDVPDKSLYAISNHHKSKSLCQGNVEMRSLLIAGDCLFFSCVLEYKVQACVIVPLRVQT